jgi:general secretion pathway protein D
LNRTIAIIIWAAALFLSLSAPVQASKQGVVLNFSDVDISTMVKFISELTGRNFVMDDRVKGKISVYSPSRISPDEAFNIFTSVLEMKGFTVIQAGRVYKIVPTSSARQAGLRIFTGKERGPLNDSYVARVLTLENLAAQDAVAFLQPLVSKDGYLTALGAANMMLVVDSDLNVHKLMGILKIVDSSQKPGSKINVYYLENADATDVAKVLDGVVKESFAVSAQTGAQQGGGSQQSAFESGRIIITPDKATNSLVIQASTANYRNILEVIRKLDIRRRQVFVQAVIAEISLDRLKEFGTQVAVGGGSDGKTSTAGTFDPFNFLSGATPQHAAIVAALQAMTGNTRIGANVKALFTNGVINVLSTPTIMTSDNKEAEIFVGENVPLITQANLSSTGLSQQSVERKDTGIVLRLTPQITEGDYLKLDIYQEISAVTEDKGQAVDLVTTKRSARTSVVVKDKETVAIGGLIQDRDTSSVRKIPLLGDIPVLGWLFKTTSSNRVKTNLMILLTPRIIKSSEDMAQVSSQQKQTFESAVNSDKPFNLDKHLQPGK